MYHFVSHRVAYFEKLYTMCVYSNDEMSKVDTIVGFYIFWGYCCCVVYGVLLYIYDIPAAIIMNIGV